MAGTGIKGYTGAAQYGGSYDIKDGIIQNGSSHSVSNDSPVMFHNGSSPVMSEFASGLGAALGSSDTPYTDWVRDVLAFSERNSAFNASQAEIARDWSADQNMLAMRHSASEAQRLRDWQERMSNTSHQREVQDLIKAGLNPVLSATAGASTPAGAAGNGYTSSASSASADQSANLSGLFSSMIGSATQLEMKNKELDWQEAYAAITAGLQRERIAADLVMSENAKTATLGAASMTSEASRYGSNVNSAINAANRDTQKYIAQLQETGKDNRDWLGLLGRVISGFSGEQDPYRELGKVLRDYIEPDSGKYPSYGKFGADHFSP